MKNSKKVLSILLTMALLLVMVPSAMASDNIKVKVGGEKVKFDVQPQIMNGRTMVPLRAIFEALGASVEWNAETRTVTSTKGVTTISLTIDSPTMLVNGNAVTLDSPACIVDSRTLVPVRAISEAFNLKVEWVDSTRTVKVKVPVSVISEDSEGYKYTYDENGNRIYGTGPDGAWEKYTYDENGNKILVETSYDYVLKYTYDENDNLIYFEGPDWWEKYTYDANDNLTYHESSNKDREKYIYDSNGKLVLQEEYSEYSDGRWTKCTYDGNGNRIYYENSDGDWERTTYNEKGYKTYCERSFGGKTHKVSYKNYTIGNTHYCEGSDGHWEKYTYDENGVLILREYNDTNFPEECFFEKYVYDQNGNLTYYEDCNTDFPYVERYTYDKNGYLIYHEYSDGYWKSWEKYIIIEK